jgi:pimeloyl-ACP methyl ester carboxylesterase
MSMDTAVLPAAAPSAPAPPPPDAIIFVPGLLHDQETQSVDVIALRMIHALNRNAKKGAAIFTPSEGKDETYQGGKTRVITVSRQDPKGGGDYGAAVPIFDLYGFDYRQALVGQYEKKKPIMQALAIGGLLLVNAHRIVGAFFGRRSKTLAQKLQTFYAGLVFFVLALYMVVLLATAIGTAVKAIPDPPKAAATTATAQQQEAAAGSPGQTDAPPRRPAAPPPAWYARWWQTGWGWVSATWAWSLGYLQMAVIGFAALGLFTRTNVKATLANVSSELACAADYLATGGRGGTLAGQFSLLLDHIEEKSDASKRAYSNVHVVGFSFGTIISLNAIFPHGEPNERLRCVSTLVTVGCPFDFIRTYWPAYFDSRLGWPDTPRKWVNIYAPADVLGSDFRDAGPDGSWKQSGVTIGGKLLHPDEDKNVKYGQSADPSVTSPWEFLTLNGFKVHGLYWEKGQAHDVSCIDDIIRQLYRGHYALS